MGIPNPWRVLRDMPHVVLSWRSDLPAYLRGATDGERIWMRSDLSQVERRCVLTHELVHVRRGHTTCQPASVERAVQETTARWLLPDAAVVADALVWSAGDVDEAADVLWVTPRVLRHRLDPRNLTATERAVLAARADELEIGA